MTRDKFIDSMVDIAWVEQSESYGHYPFQLYVQTEDGKIELHALALGGDVAGCYMHVKKYRNANAKKIFLALDFPAGGDIKDDFVAVCSVVDGKSECVCIPYDPKTGDVKPVIKEGEQLQLVLSQFNDSTT